MPLLTRTAGQMIVNFGVVPGLQHENFLASRLSHMGNAAPTDVVVLHMPSHKQNNAFNCTFLPEADKLWDEGVTERVLNLKPRLVVVPKLYHAEITPEQHAAFLNNIKQILQTGAVVETALSPMEIARMNDLLDPHVPIPPTNAITGDFLRGHVGDYIVHDMSPQEILALYYGGGIPVPAYLKGNESTLYNMHNLVRLREVMLSWVSTHNGDVARSLNLTQLTPEHKFTWMLWNKTLQHGLIALPVNAVWFTFVNILWNHLNFSLPAVSLMLLAAPLVTALYVNPVVATLNALLTFTAFNLVFHNATDALDITSNSGILTLLAFLTVTLVTCFLGARRNFEHMEQEEQTVQLNALFRLSYDMAYSDTVEDIVQAAISNLRRTFSKPALLLDANCNPWEAREKELSMLNEKEKASAAKAIKLGTIITPQKGENWVWSPLVIKQAVLGVIGLRTGPQPGASDIDTMQIMRSYSDIVSTSLRRAELRKASEDATQEAERENLRAALLSAVSHDLKTPLVSIIGSLSTLQALGSSMPEDYRKELLQTASEEASRLHTIIHNVLEMTRFESGSVKPNITVIDVSSVMPAVIERSQRYYPKLKLNVQPADLSNFWLKADPLLLEEVLYNIIDNAAKYAGRESTLDISLENLDDSILMRLCDNGPGIPVHEREKVFDKYYRASHKDAHQAGSGLGLAICRIILDACGAHIWAEDRPDGNRGTCMAIRFPKATPSEIKENDHE